MIETTKWNQFGTSIFTTMSKKALATNSVNLAQGFPDFDGPEEIKKAAIEAISKGINQYAPSAGLRELRQLLSQRQNKTTGLSFDADTEVTVFSGATEAIYCAFQAFFTAGDEILSLSPFYDSYPAAAFNAGAKLIDIPLTNGSWDLDCAGMEAAITPNTRAMIINTPHNPTGRVLNAEEMEFLRIFAIKHDLLVITDEVYEELVFAPSKHISMATLEGMRERTLTISSTSKTFSMTGWKVGYAFGSPALTNAIRAVHQFTVFCSATPLQVGMTAALKLSDDYYEDFRRDYFVRRDKIVSILKDTGFKCSAPQGTYFVMADYSKHKNVSDIEFTNWLAETVGVAAIPVSVFYSDQAKARETMRAVRFGFCKDNQTLDEAHKRLKKLK